MRLWGICQNEKMFPQELRCADSVGCLASLLITKWLFTLTRHRDTQTDSAAAFTSTRHKDTQTQQPHLNSEWSIPTEICGEVPGRTSRGPTGYTRTGHVREDQWVLKLSNPVLSKLITRCCLFMLLWPPAKLNTFLLEIGSTMEPSAT